jgi:hypothetical protein
MSKLALPFLAAVALFLTAASAFAYPCADQIVKAPEPVTTADAGSPTVPPVTRPADGG